ncbi:MAG: tetraacyldisaccharide 4'-kinase, partial [Ignavibacteria bacterium]
MFRIIVYIRNRLYDYGLLKTTSLNTSVISVGNVSTGGTGKTPMVEYLATHFLNRGKLIAIISKGYKRIHDDIRVAELGFKNERRELSIENFGDESLVLLENLSNIKTVSGKKKGLLVVSEDKTKGAEFAYKKFKPEIIIIDDGFQHRKLRRDIDIVILNQQNPRNLIPAGKLREPLSNIKRANMIVLNKKFASPGQDDFHKIEAEHPSTIVCEYKFESFFNSKNKKVNINSEASITAFCGIGEPESFRNLLKNQNINIKGFIVFPDHHYYTIKDKGRIVDKF